MRLTTQQKIHRLSSSRFLFFSSFGVPATVRAADADLRPGDTIGPNSWERAKGMVGENLLNRIKGGYSFQIKESRPRKFPKEYLDATEKHAARVSFGANGELLNYVAGIPFPKLEFGDPQAGLFLGLELRAPLERRRSKRRWRHGDWQGVVVYISKNGSERRWR